MYFTTGFVTHIRYWWYSGNPIVYVYIRDSLPDGMITPLWIPENDENRTSLSAIRDALIHGIEVKVFTYWGGKILKVALSVDQDGFAAW